MEEVPPCRLCGLKVFLDQEHKNLFHLREKENRCLFCAFLFATSRSLFHHIKSEHDDGIVYCFLCKQTLKDYELLLEHIDSHVELHVYGCIKCSWTCANKIKFLEHTCDKPASECIVVDSDNEPRPSQIQSSCSLSEKRDTEDVNKPKFDIQNVSNKFRDKERTQFIASCLKNDGYYHCTLCPKKLKTSRAFRYHIYKHNNLLDFVCKKCGREFPTNSKLKDHSALHKMKSRHLCKVCGNLYKTKHSLALHVIKHRGGFTCAHCSVKFTTKFRVKSHVTVKTCCGKILRCRTLYEKHIKKSIHRFKCEYCDTSFDFDLKLKRHYALRHKDILGKHPCTNCDYVGLSLIALHRHERRSCKKKKRSSKRLLRQKKPPSS